MRLSAFIILSLFIKIAVNAQPLPYQNPDLSPKERAADLCSRLTLEEKTKLMMNSSPAIERLGIPAFEWWSEALHGVGRNGLATVFPSCIGMAASFDDDLIEQIFTAISDEARAKNTQARGQGKMGKYKGLSFWTPTINIFRDPRWGRGQETYGEDPYMNGRMGLRVVRGLQATVRRNTSNSSPVPNISPCTAALKAHATASTSTISVRGICGKAICPLSRFWSRTETYAR